MEEKPKPVNKLCQHWLLCDNRNHCAHGKPHKDVLACHTACRTREFAVEECLTIEVQHDDTELDG